MGAVANAVQLMGDYTFKQYCQAVAVYTARNVVSEPTNTANHSVRLSLALKVLDNPEYLTSRLVAVLATTPEIAGLGTTIGDNQDISEGVIIQAAASAWTSLAQLDSSV